MEYPVAITLYFDHFGTYKRSEVVEQFYSVRDEAIISGNAGFSGIGIDVSSNVLRSNYHDGWGGNRNL